MIDFSDAERVVANLNGNTSKIEVPAIVKAATKPIKKRHSRAGTGKSPGGVRKRRKEGKRGADGAHDNLMKEVAMFNMEHAGRAASKASAAAAALAVSAALALGGACIAPDAATAADRVTAGTVVDTAQPKATAAKVKMSKVKVAKVGARGYTGKAIKPAVKARYKGKALKRGRDFTVKYKNNKKKGTASVVVTGKGRFTGKKTVKFKIVAKTNLAKKAKVAKVGAYNYTGGAVKPPLSVKVGKKKLKAGRDYTVKYANNVNVGTATATVKGKNLYSGKKTVKFKIVKSGGLTAPPAGNTGAGGNAATGNGSATGNAAGSGSTTGGSYLAHNPTADIGMVSSDKVAYGTQTGTKKAVWVVDQAAKTVTEPEIKYVSLTGYNGGGGFAGVFSLSDDTTILYTEYKERKFDHYIDVYGKGGWDKSWTTRSTNKAYDLTTSKKLKMPAVWIEKKGSWSSLLGYVHAHNHDAKEVAEYMYLGDSQYSKQQVIDQFEPLMADLKEINGKSSTIGNYGLFDDFVYTGGTMQVSYPEKGHWEMTLDGKTIAKESSSHEYGPSPW